MYIIQKKLITYRFRFKQARQLLELKQLLEFSCELLDDKGKTIKFYDGETKVLVFDFIINIFK